MKRFDKEDIEDRPKAYRRTFMNSVSGFKNCVLVGTADSARKSNLALFNTCIHLGAHPPALAILFRTLSVSRQTYENIRETGVFTINHVHESFVDKAHQTSAKYEPEVSEFDACGFTEEWTDGFGAPMVKESAIRIGLSFAEEHTLAVSDTVLVCGRVEFISLPEQLIGTDGYVDAAAARSVCVNGLDAYHRTQLIQRYSYARPGQALTVIGAE
jgi:flavin reductase (DIM6/NTAB) family NADH-FMN oxidoreductase RutF